MIPIARPILGPEEKAAVMEVLDSGHLAQGARVREFEDRFAAFCGVRHAVATSSGTAALHTALLAHGIRPGDEVITTPFTFVATANAILYVGATPVFADIDPGDYCIRPEEVAARVTQRTRAILVVHLYGQPCDMERLLAIARAHNLVVIEDACQAHGAAILGEAASSGEAIPPAEGGGAGRMVGSFGTGCFSFYPTKNMTTAEGGMLTTDDDDVAERARLIRQHGASERYRHEVLGFNYRMTEIQGAIGLAQLAKLPAWTQQRQANAAYLSSHLENVAGIEPPRIRPGTTHVFHQYTVRVRARRDEVAQRLAEHGVETAVHYPLAVHRQPLYQERELGGSHPEAERASREVLSLPVHPQLAPADLEQIVTAVRAL